MTSSSLTATVILPTTGDRAPVLRHSISAIQRQSVQDLELFIIGDGVDDTARALITTIAAQDQRVRFFDHPKHARRGELYRHEALQQARGQTVCYACDRDLLLPHHVRTHADLCRQYNLVYTLALAIERDNNAAFVRRSFFGALDDTATTPGRPIPPTLNPAAIQLSAVSHSLAAYRQLPAGWRTTPAGIATDQYMWEQFLEQPWCRAFSSADATLLYFKRGDHPGMSSAERGRELDFWVDRITDAQAIKALHEQALQTEIFRATHFAALVHQAPLLVRGRSVSEWIRYLNGRLRAK